MVLVTAASSLKVSLDTEPLAQQLRGIAAAFAQAAERIEATAADVVVSPTGDAVVVDRTGLCDHCDKPQTGGAAGGGLPPENWCDDHRPADWPGSFDDVADDSAPDDEHPASVGQVPLLLDVARAHSAWIDADEDYRPLAEIVVGVVRERLSQYQGSTPISQVFTDWFGAR